MKKSIKQKICLGILGISIYSLSMPMLTYAAPMDNKKAVSVAEQTSTVDPLSFTARIQKILEDGEKARQAILQGESGLEQKAQENDSKTVQKDKTAPVPEEHASNKSEEIQPSTSQQSEMQWNASESYNFDWQGTPLSQALYSIGKIAGKKVVVNGQLSGNVYTSLYGVTYNQALNYLAKVYNFNWMLDDDGNAILISTSDLMLQNHIFDIRYADKNKIKDELKSLGIDEKNIYVNDEYSTISLTSTPYQINQASKLISKVDKPVAQCLLIAQLIEISHGKDIDLGMNYSLPTYTHTADDSKSNTMKGKFIDKLTFSASAEANRALSKGKVVARPMTMAKNGQEATVYFGDSVPVQSSTTTSSSTQVTFDFKDVGTGLKMTPIINEKDGEVRLSIDVNLSNISKWVKYGSSEAPQISSRKANTVITLKSGQNFVIGGLMTSQDLDNLSGIPGLMDLPILGNLFRYHSVSKTNTEVFIMVTPYIVSNDTDPEALLKGMKEHAN